MPKAKAEKSPDVSAVTLKNLSDALAALETRVVKLETPEPKKEETKPVSPAVNSPVEYKGFREMVDEILNKNFTFEVENGDNPAFMNFVLSVPKKYSNAGQPHWELYHSDLRPRAFALREADIMVRDHLNRVFSNFNPDIKALIVNDR